MVVNQDVGHSADSFGLSLQSACSCYTVFVLGYCSEAGVCVEVIVNKCALFVQ